MPRLVTHDNFCQRLVFESAIGMENALQSAKNTSSQSCEITDTADTSVRNFWLLQLNASEPDDSLPARGQSRSLSEQVNQISTQVSSQNTLSINRGWMLFSPVSGRCIVCRREDCRTLKNPSLPLRG